MSCISCNSKFNRENFDFGKQFKCNAFYKNTGEYNKLKKYKLKLVSCKKCSLIQILKPINYRQLLPKFSWMKNKEEDSYHKKYVHYLLKKNLLKKNSKILGISEYDKTYLETLRANNFRNINTISLKKDLNVKENFSQRQEIIQNYLSKKYLKAFLKKNGKYDLIVCSKMLEHTQNIKNILGFFRAVMKKNALLLVDVPDSKTSLLQGNVSMIWEEHISYFTPKTLHNTLSINGFKKKLSKVFFFKQENNLVFLYKNSVDNFLLYNEKKILGIFKKKVKFIKKKLIQILDNKFFLNIIYGAGHNSIAFINFLGLSKYISYIVDDDKKKRNFKVTESQIPIKDLNYLKKQNKPYAFFLGTSIKSEKKIKKIVNTIKSSKLFSLYPDSKLFF